MFKQQVPGCPARPARASEHTGLQGRVAPKTLRTEPRLRGSPLGCPVWERARGRGHIFRLPVGAEGTHTHF